MKLITIKSFFVLIYLISSSATYSIEHTNIKNLIFHEKTKKLGNIEFKNLYKDTVNLVQYKNKLIILNFWATWCAPCIEEMPSLNQLKKNRNFINLEIFPINVAQEDIEKQKIFFKNLKINDLEIYLDSSMSLVKKFTLRGLPTTILINKQGEEFARILGAIDFTNDEFVSWLKNFD